MIKIMRCHRLHRGYQQYAINRPGQRFHQLRFSDLESDVWFCDPAFQQCDIVSECVSLARPGLVLLPAVSLPGGPSGFARNRKQWPRLIAVHRYIDLDSLRAIMRNHPWSILFRRGRCGRIDATGLRRPVQDGGIFRDRNAGRRHGSIHFPLVYLATRYRLLDCTEMDPIYSTTCTVAADGSRQAVVLNRDSEEDLADCIKNGV